MVLNKELLNDAMNHLSAYYNKIIFVDCDTNVFECVKIEAEELDALKHDSLKKWLLEFLDSGRIRQSEWHDVRRFFNDILLFKEPRPMSTCYEKKINGEWVYVILQIVPIDKSHYYILVKNMEDKPWYV